MLVIDRFNQVGGRDSYKGAFKALKIEGSDELSVLCPVSKLTGYPMSMQQAIFMITDKNSRLADILFQEIPAIRDSDQLSDDDKFKLLVSRLDSGSFAENDNVSEILGNIAKEFFPAADVEEVVNVASQKIDFSKSDEPSTQA